MSELPRAWALQKRGRWQALHVVIDHHSRFGLQLPDAGRREGHERLLVPAGCAALLQHARRFIQTLLLEWTSASSKLSPSGELCGITRLVGPRVAPARPALVPLRGLCALRTHRTVDGWSK